MRQGLVLGCCGVVLTGCVAAWAVTGDLTRHIGLHLTLFTGAFAAYLLALHASRGLTRRGLAAVLGLGILWRGLLVAAPPLLSDDVYRYVWEGRIQLHGGNPFAWSDRPEAAHWLGLRDAVWQGVNHKDYAAVYPPLWQIAARSVVAVHDSVTAMKAFAVLCEVLAFVPLAAFLRRRGLPRERILILAWSPLALVEIAGSGHNDALGILLVATALWAVGSSHSLVSALALAGGVHVKLLPALFGLAWARHYRVREVVLGILVIIVLIVPYADAGAGLVHSLTKYASFWRFNETGFALLAALGGSHEAAVRWGALLTASLAGGLAWRRVEPVTAGLAVTAAWLLLAPNVLPWYALWLLPWLVVVEAPWALVFTGTVQLAYLVYPGWLSGGPWSLPPGVRALEYLPCAAVALWACRRGAGGLLGSEGGPAQGSLR